MCGIVGYYFNNNHIRKTSPGFTESIKLLSHRGPDNSDLFVDPIYNLGLAHTRLSILDLSKKANQPMKSLCEDVVLIFNGEIYNFNEINSLIKENSKLRCLSNSDSEVLLNLYIYNRDQGNDISRMLKMLNGIFAFAIWDKTTEDLFIVRDALGVKPLYYSQNQDGFIFSSEIKAMIPLGIDSKEIDPIAINRYLSFLWCPGERTASKNIKKLPPGEFLQIKNGQIHKRTKWYKLPFYKQQTYLKTKAKAIKGTQYHLRNAVHRQLVADVQVGAFLSGGLDSSSIVKFAVEKNPNIKCFTIDSSSNNGKNESDDLKYAQLVANHLKVNLDVIKVDSNCFIKGLEDMVISLDEPIADPAPLNVFFISRLARSKGIKVLLSGAGGDDLFTGYRRHIALNNEFLWSWLPLNIRSFFHQASSLLPNNSTFNRRVRKAFSGFELEGDARIINYFRWIDRFDIERLYTKEFRGELNSSNAEQPFINLLNDLPNNKSRIEKILALEQSFFLPDHNLTYTDKMSMRSSVEVRVPFLDIDLINFAASIPDKYKINNGQAKWVLKEAMKPYLPKNVIYRPKTGFGLPLRRWVKNDIKEWLNTVLLSGSLENRGIFDSKAVESLIYNNLYDKVDASYTLLSLASIEIWCRYFIDKNQSSTIKI
ncbi:asparagine synthase (glutamine-hydrolyzing) [bacterium]|nr:asparagine synthase (glutamine-hydrolyzing) [bacterium]